MPVTSVWMLEEANITISGGVGLDGITQGDGSHLLGRTITLNSNDWLETRIDDNDTGFDDNDGNQILSGAQTIDGVSYASGTRVEAEYRLVLQNPVSGQTWVVIGYNVNNSNPSFGTIEGLAFIGPPAGWPPVGTPLIVVQATEGPGSSGQGATTYQSYVSPPCFTPGTRVETPEGPCRIETLRAGDRVVTVDKGACAIRYVTRTHLTCAMLRRNPDHCPIRFKAGSLGDGLPERDLVVSPQHRLLWSGSDCDLHLGVPEVLVAAADHPAGQKVAAALLPFGVTYIHLVLDEHHILWANGAQTESFLVGPTSYHAAPASVQADLRRLFPALSSLHGPVWQRAARPVVRPWEMRLLAA